MKYEIEMTEEQLPLEEKKEPSRISQIIHSE